MLRWFYVVRTGIRSLLIRRAFDEQLNADIRFHLEEASAEYMRAGLSPDEARRAALKAFGNPVLVVEDVRETSMWIWWERLVQDLRFAFRRLAKQKAFLFTAVPTLALCIGANTAIFSVVNSVILRPLPVPEPERVVTMWNAYPGAVGTDAMGGRYTGCSVGHVWKGSHNCSGVGRANAGPRALQGRPDRFPRLPAPAAYDGR